MALLQLSVNGLALGAAYALVALGFVLVLNATSAVNFAHGDLVMLGGYGGVFLAGWLFPAGIGETPWAGLLLLPLVGVAMAGMGLAVAAVGYLPLRRRPPVAVFLSTIALGMIFQHGALLGFGPEPRAGPALLGGGTFSVGGLMLSRQSLAILLTAGVVIAGQCWLFNRTQLGRRLRATAQDPEMARALGIPVTRMILLTFALGTALAGVAGVLLANPFFVTPTEGSALILKAYIAVTLGGWGSVPGAVLAALLMAVFEVGVSAYVSQTAAAVALYLVVLLILVGRPEGLFGEVSGRRA